MAVPGGCLLFMTFGCFLFSGGKYTKLQMKNFLHLDQLYQSKENTTNTYYKDSFGGITTS